MRQPSRSKAVATKTIFAAFEILKENGGSLPLKDLLEQIPTRVELNLWEKEVYAKSGYIRWQSIFHFYSLGCAKSGFLLKKDGIWSLTPEGELAMKSGAEGLLAASVSGYRIWAKENKKPIREEPEEEDEVVTNTVSIERIEAQARESIVNHIRSKGEYEFQDMVAALLRAMGYHTPFIAPRGPDGGVDVIAYHDPLGMIPPRLKVQVKHKPDSAIPPADVRALIGVSNRPGETGLFVTSGKFGTEAMRVARESNNHCELIDMERFIALWREFYSKMPDDDRAMLPLQAVWFLGALE
jgi:restriction system protein